MKNLKEHLLSRIHAKHQINISNLGSGVANASLMAQSNVILKDNRIYEHKLARFYHTTYDVRRSEDIINPKTSHCNIMLLSDLASKEASHIDIAVTHPFLYGCVLGIYHVNVVYTGPGMKGYKATRYDFLHVRWLQLKNVQAEGRHKASKSLHLDCLSFPPMTSANSFGFVDPALVVRTCHLIPMFSLGKSHSDGIGLSSMSKDGNDWKGYYINRYFTFHWLFFL